MIKKHFTKILIILFSCVFIGCSSTKNIRENSWAYLEKNEETEHFYQFPNEGTVLPENTERYIFLRLYNPHAKYNLGTVILQKGLEYVEQHDVSGSHIAIGFDLTDNFYGLTLYANPNLKKEQCTNTLSNEFMKSCDPQKSLQTTFAYPVSQKEYETAIAWVNRKLQNQSTSYSIADNFKMAGVAVKRKNNHDSKKMKKTQTKEEEFREFEKMNKFVCSTFISHVLFSSVDSIRNYMNENLIDPNYVMPTDIVTMPGMQRLFTSTWDEFNNSAKNFTSENPKFSKYLVKNPSTL